MFNHHHRVDTTLIQMILLLSFQFESKLSMLMTAKILLVVSNDMSYGKNTLKSKKKRYYNH